MKRALLLIAATILAAACATATRPQTPAQSVYAAQGVYAAALSVAVAYKELPACGQPTSPLLCSDKAVVAKLQAADDCAFATLTVAQNLVRGGSLPIALCGDANVNAAIQSAGTSVPAVLALVSQTTSLFQSLTAQVRVK